VGASLRELRRLVGDKSGFVTVLVVSHDSDSTSTVRDTARLADRENQAASIVNRSLYFSGGTEANWGHVAAVTDFDGTTKTITFSPDAPTTPLTGDTVELWPVHEVVSPEAVNRLINYAINAVADFAGAEEYATAQTFNARTGTLEIPATWAEFGGADWTGSTGYVSEIRPQWMRVAGGRHLVTIRGMGAALANRRSVALFGYPRALPLVNEDDETPVNAEWLVESVTQAITLAKSWNMHDPAAAERRSQFWANQAMVYRRNISPPRRGLGIFLP
jgi:hypothetical protein